MQTFQPCSAHAVGWPVEAAAGASACSQSLDGWAEVHVGLFKAATGAGLRDRAEGRLMQDRATQTGRWTGRGCPRRLCSPCCSSWTLPRWAGRCAAARSGAGWAATPPSGGPTWSACSPCKLRIAPFSPCWVPGRRRPLPRWRPQVGLLWGKQFQFQFQFQGQGQPAPLELAGHRLPHSRWRERGSAWQGGAYQRRESGNKVGCVRRGRTAVQACGLCC